MESIYISDEDTENYISSLRAKLEDLNSAFQSGRISERDFRAEYKEIKSGIITKDKEINRSTTTGKFNLDAYLKPCIREILGSLRVGYNRNIDLLQHAAQDAMSRIDYYISAMNNGQQQG